MGREVVEVGDGGAAPAVDRLAGVADGGHRVPRTAAEQPGQQPPLGDGGVLVLVQQHHPALLAQQPPDRRVVLGEQRGVGDLVAEVEQVAAALLAPVGPYEVEQLQPGLRGSGGLAQFVVGEPDAVETGELPGAEVRQRVGLHEVFRQLGVEREEFADERREGLRQGGVRAGGGAQDVGGELVAGGVGEEAGAGFEADAQAVVLEQLAYEGVVRGDPRLAGLRGAVARHPVAVRAFAVRPLRTAHAA